ncbi:AP-1 complex subunit gamma-1 isoform X2 [Zeugodacus cucurbitae]|uniref:AP-1 complex subunit gamma-1 isoform X2 n=1 Tax=Zeugodacus cucurbitae TaxID=28588 RepID=UPI0023D90706|nr:AP-1 complex subunit gamma-1 isoform X2 [Zeugodacus cucurbitae]
MPQGPILTVLNKNDLLVQLVPVRRNDHLQIFMTTTNNSPTTLEEYICQAAVPRAFSLQMLSPSAMVLPPGGVITQELRVVSTSNAILRMRLRILYTVDGQLVVEQTEVTGFPDAALE